MSKSTDYHQISALMRLDLFLANFLISDLLKVLYQSLFNFIPAQLFTLNRVKLDLFTETIMYLQVSCRSSNIGR